MSVPVEPEVVGAHKNGKHTADIALRLKGLSHEGFVLTCFCQQKQNMDKKKITKKKKLVKCLLTTTDPMIKFNLCAP